MKIFINIILVSIIAFVSYRYGGLVSSSAQLGVYDSLLNVSAIIFGIMGAWVAIVYPDALSKVFKNNTDLEENHESVKRLFIPMRVATVIVALSVLMKWIVPVLKKIEWVVENK